MSTIKLRMKLLSSCFRATCRTTCWLSETCLLILLWLWVCQTSACQSFPQFLNEFWWWRKLYKKRINWGVLKPNLYVCTHFRTIPLSDILWLHAGIMYVNINMLHLHCNAPMDWSTFTISSIRADKLPHLCRQTTKREMNCAFSTTIQTQIQQISSSAIMCSSLSKPPNSHFKQTASCNKLIEMSCSTSTCQCCDTTHQAFDTGSGSS